MQRKTSHSKTGTRTRTSLSKKQEHHLTLTALPSRCVEYFGVVNYATTERVIEETRALYTEVPNTPIYLNITSAGGPTGTAMSFYDHMRYVLKASLITIGAGDVDSSGIILLQTGHTRFLTPHTTLLLHSAGRMFEPGIRYTAGEIEAMYKEDRIKDLYYASILAEHSHGKLTQKEILQLMDKQTLLSAPQAVTYGFADAIVS